MSNIITMGGSVAGLLTSMQLARAGHHVTVLERESQAVVAAAADTPVAPRPGALHAVHGHALLSRAAVEIRRALPEAYAALISAGVGVLDLVAAMPATIADRAPRAGDDELVMLQSRRQSFDRVLVDVALKTPRLELRFDTAVAGLLIAQGGSFPPRVTGVRTSNGGTLNADVVIDASGRRTSVPAWLAAVGVELPLEAWDCGLIYFTRHYRVRRGVERPPLNRVFSAGGQLASWRVSWFPGDNDTAMLVHTILAEDQLLKSVRRVECFEAVACAVPSIAAWHECSEPISEVFAMGALRNTLRGLVRDGQPLVLGLHLVGDAACTTNPVLGRGISFAAISAANVVRAIADAPDDPAAQAIRIADAAAQEIEPRFRENALNDQAIAQRLRADLAGESPRTPATRAADRVDAEELLLGGMRDAELYRASMRHGQLLARETLLADPSMIERVRKIVPAGMRAPALAGPSRAELARIIAAA